MISIFLFGVFSAVGVLVGARELAVPVPLIPALVGVALFAAAAVIKRKGGRG